MVTERKGVLDLARFALFWLTKKAKRDLRFVGQALADTFRAPTPPAAPDPVLSPSDPQALSVTWIGHATVMIDFFGVRILTDPVLGDRVGPSLGPIVVGPKRYVSSPIRPQSLTDLDVVLISHAHMDHLDLNTLNRLRGARHVVSAVNTVDLIPARLAAERHEAAWWSEHTLHANGGTISVIPFPVRHPGARWRHDVHRTCNAYVLQRNGLNVAFIGDTAFDTGFTEVRKRVGDVDVAIVPIGAYDPYVWNHATPEQAVEIAKMLGAERVLPIHHSTFKLSREPLHEPLARFEAASREHGLEVVRVRHGERALLHLPAARARHARSS